MEMICKNCAHLGYLGGYFDIKKGEDNKDILICARFILDEELEDSKYAMCGFEVTEDHTCKHFMPA